MPLLKLKQALRGMPPGAVIRVETTDPGSRADIASWCRASGHLLLSADDAADVAGMTTAIDGALQTAASIYSFTIRVAGGLEDN